MWKLPEPLRDAIVLLTVVDCSVNAAVHGSAGGSVDSSSGSSSSSGPGHYAVLLNTMEAEVHSEHLGALPSSLKKIN